MGQKVIKEALLKGYKLRVLARDPKKVASHPQVQVIQGDALNENALRELVNGVDAVVSTLGPSGINLSIKQAKKNAGELLCYNTSKILIPLLNQQDIKRYILTTGASLETPEDENSWFMSFLLTKFARKILGPLATDREYEYQLLSQSDIEFTYARCAAMDKNANPGEIKTHAHVFQGGKVNIGSLAAFLIDQIEDKSFIRQAVYVAT